MKLLAGQWMRKRLVYAIWTVGEPRPGGSALSRPLQFCLTRLVLIVRVWVQLDVSLVVPVHIAVVEPEYRVERGCGYSTHDTPYDHVYRVVRVLE